LLGSRSSTFNALVVLDDPLANYLSSCSAGSQPFIDAAGEDLSSCCWPGIPLDAAAGKNQEDAELPLADDPTLILSRVSYFDLSQPCAL
jgi:hypothetical protein